MDVFVACFANCGGKRLAGNSGNRIFTRGIDVGQNEDVSLIESLAEVVPEMLRARETVRLKKDEQAIELAAAGCLKRGANLCWVMPVIVNDGDIGDDTLNVKAASNAGELGEAFAD